MWSGFIFCLKIIILLVRNQGKRPSRQEFEKKNKKITVETRNLRKSVL